MKELKNIKNFIFDCDGVILNSNEIKSNAFAQSLKDEPTDLVDAFIEYHKQII